MPVSFLMNHNVPFSVTEGLRIRNVDVMNAFEDGSHMLSDSQLLERAELLGRILFSHDDDLLKEAKSRLKKGKRFNGLIYSHQLNISIGKCIEDLELIANACNVAELEDQIIFLPLK
jgi:hypothetical protein